MEKLELGVTVLGVALALANLASIGLAVWLLVRYQKTLSFAAELIARMTEESVAYTRKADADSWAAGRHVPHPETPPGTGPTSEAQALKNVARGMVEDANLVE